MVISKIQRIDNGTSNIDKTKDLVDTAAALHLSQLVQPTRPPTPPKRKVGIPRSNLEYDFSVWSEREDPSVCTGLGADWAAGKDLPQRQTTRRKVMLSSTRHRPGRQYLQRWLR